MSFIDDKMYKLHLVPRMGAIASKVKALEIMPHLPCLTDHDRETIVAKRDASGNYNSMGLLLDCMKRRENWPEQFITALEACDHPTLAAELRAEYNALRAQYAPRGSSNSSPSSPQTTVTRAHVHTQPSASHSSVQETGVNTPAAVSAPAGVSTPPPEPAAQPSPPPKTPPSSEVQAPEAVSPPEPAAEPPQADPAPPPAPAPAPALSTPPPSPPSTAAPRPQTPPPSPTQSEPARHQEPEENSEPGDLSQEISADVSPTHVAPPQPSSPVKQRETTITTTTSTITTTTTAAEVTPPQSPPPTQINSDVTDGSSFPVVTPEKAPVQDSSPPVDTEPATVQVEAAATGDAGMDTAIIDDSSVCLSKPTELVSVHPQVQNSPAVPEPSSPEGPYSGDSQRLEISNIIPVTAPHVPACSESTNPAPSPPPPPLLQENGISYSEPEENQYDSPCPSLDMDDVRVNVVQLSEELSILNQSPSPDAPKGNGEAAKEMVSPPPPSTTTTTFSTTTATTAETAPSENHRPSEPELKTQQNPEEEISGTMLPANTKYILTAAGVGACALLMAWKFKN